MHLAGSEWRRWDLHIHTPGTALNNQFGDWDECLAVIEAQSEVRVLGVTDVLATRASVPPGPLTAVSSDGGSDARVTEVRL